MKRNKKMLTLAAALAVVMGVSACGGGSAANGQDVAELISNSAAVMNEVESMTTNMTMELNMESGDEAVEMLTNMDMIIISEPMKGKIDMTIDMGEIAEPQTVSMYLQEEEGKVISYIEQAGTWYAVEADADMTEKMDAASSTTEYLEGMEDFAIGGTEDLNGVATTRIDGVIKGETLQDAMESSGALSSVENMGLSQEELLAMYEDIGEMPVSMWIGEDGYVYRYEMDMTVMMQKIMDNVMAAYAEGDDSMKIMVSKVLITMDCSDFNAVTDFEIPAEALAAERIAY